MNEYELIYESLCDAVDNGEIDAEFAEAVNDLAYDKYKNGQDIVRKSSTEFLDMLKERQISNKQGVLEIKLALKNNDFDSACKKVDSLISETKELKQQISSMSPTIFDLVGSEIAATLSTFAVFKLLSRFYFSGFCANTKKRSLKTTGIGAGATVAIMSGLHSSGKRDIKQSNTQRHCIKMLDTAIDDLNKLKYKIVIARKKGVDLD